MNRKSFFHKTIDFLSASAILAMVIVLLVEPQRAMKGALQGLSLCCQVIIPSLFPFLVLSRLLLESPLAGPLGAPLSPYTKCLGIPSRKAAGALLCGLLGGFAAGASAVEQLYEAGELTKQEAERLLVCCIGSSPAFIVGSVGAVMLHSVFAGWLLFLSQVSASLICGAFFRISKASRTGVSLSSLSLPKTLPRGIPNAIEKAVFSTSILCGYIILFSFLAEMLAPATLPALPRFLLTLPLEVTNACRAGASAVAARLTLCDLALSFMGFSVFLQVRSLTCAHFSLKALLVSRIPHAFLSLLLLKALLYFLPNAQTASTAIPSLFAFRMPLDVICIFFLLCVMITCHRKNFSSLPSQSNGV